jgi:hypothetical protein
MENFTMAELGVFCGVVGGVLTSLVLTFQKSKCETINCCGVKCRRKIKDPVPPVPPNDQGEEGGEGAGVGLVNP